MTAEAHQITARLASSAWFPMVVAADVRERALIAHAQADGNVVTITVTNAAAGSGTRTCQARVEFVSGECRHCTAPVDRGDLCTFCASCTRPDNAAALSPAGVLP
ncbi:hypothetical protein GR927_15585 [Mycolicibacterium sp. 3033]|nr:hypothetical protein [Mycolicibacterium aurantiacum]